jgi:hypothetical protein
VGTSTALKDHLTAWRAAGIVDAATAARIETFEMSHAVVAPPGDGINPSEVVAYIGSVILLVGLGFLYGTEYRQLGSAGRLVMIGLVIVAGLASGDLVGRLGASAAARRARSAGWAVASLAVAAWFAQAFLDANVLTHRGLLDGYRDPGGPIMLAAGIGTLVAASLLWRAGAGLIAFVMAVLAYVASAALRGYFTPALGAWPSEAIWLASAVALGLASEVLTVGPERLWAREVVRFAAVLPPIVAALVFSSSDTTLEFLAGFLVAVAFGCAVIRSSAGYAISAGVALFLLVSEVGARHFAQSLGFPIVLVASGITLILVAAGMFQILPRLAGQRPTQHVSVPP